MRLGLISDIHANRPALEAVLNDADERGLGSVYCLGDIVGYGPDPNGVIDLLRERDIPSLAGNYDDGVGYERGDCGCYYPDNEARRIGDASYAFTVVAVGPEQKAWLRALPGERYVAGAGHRVHLVHGSPRRINEYLFEDRDERTFRRLAEAEEPQTDVLAFGHTHVPWHRRFGGLLFVNAGSVGRPKDGDTRAIYTVLELAPGEEPRVEAVRVTYDVEQTVAGVRAVGLPESLARAFAEGR